MRLRRRCAIARVARRRSPPSSRSSVTLRAQRALTGMLETTFIPIDQRRLTAIGTGVLRYGTAFLLLMWGAFKFTSFEAEGIRPLVEHHPLMSWMYPVFGVRGTSDVIGIIEVSAGALMCARRFSPRWSALGSTLAAVTFAITI